MPVLMAVSTKTLSLQTIGLAVPFPSIGTFHWMFFSSLHSVGGVADEETPVASGPRH